MSSLSDSIRNQVTNYLIYYKNLKGDSGGITKRAAEDKTKSRKSTRRTVKPKEQPAYRRVPPAPQGWVFLKPSQPGTVPESFKTIPVTTTETLEQAVQQGESIARYADSFVLITPSSIKRKRAGFVLAVKTGENELSYPLTEHTASGRYTVVAAAKDFIRALGCNKSGVDAQGHIIEISEEEGAFIGGHYGKLFAVIEKKPEAAKNIAFVYSKLYEALGDSAKSSVASKLSRVIEDYQLNLKIKDQGRLDKSKAEFKRIVDSDKDTVAKILNSVFVTGKGTGYVHTLVELTSKITENTKEVLDVLNKIDPLFQKIDESKYDDYFKRINAIKQALNGRPLDVFNSISEFQNVVVLLLAYFGLKIPDKFLIDRNELFNSVKSVEKRIVDYDAKKFNEVFGVGGGEQNTEGNQGSSGESEEDREKKKEEDWAKVFGLLKEKPEEVGNTIENVILQSPQFSKRVSDEEKGKFKELVGKLSNKEELTEDETKFIREFFEKLELNYELLRD